MLAFPPPYRSFLRSLAQLALLLAGPLAPAQVKISPAEAWVLQGGERAFTAARTDGRDAQWAWTLLEGGPGGLLNPNTGLYHAPQHVAGPRACQIQVADLADPAVRARAMVYVTPTLINLCTAYGRAVVEGGTNLPVAAIRADGQAPVWHWSVVEPDGGVVVSYLQGTTIYQAPRLAEPATFHLRVQDLNHPGDHAERAIQVVPSLINLRFANPQAEPLRAGQTCDLEATTADHRPTTWTWTQPQTGGTLEVLGPGLARFRAFAAGRPSTAQVRVTCGSKESATLIIRVQPSINLTTVTSSHVISGNVCELRAAYPAQGGVAHPARWDWQVVTRSALVPGRLDEDRHGDRFSFVAPEVGWPTRFTIRAADSQSPQDRADIDIHVLPRLAGLTPGDAADVFQQVMPHIMGADWLAPAPGMTLLAGHLGAPGRGQVQPFNGIHCIAYVEAEAAMGWLSRKWLVGDRTGIKVVNARGEITPLPGVFGSVTAIAVRPPGSAPGNRDRIAFANTGDRACMISVLKNNRTPEPLAGTLTPTPMTAQFEVGRGRNVAFGVVGALAWTGDGGLWVVDRHGFDTRQRRIDPDGQVTMVGRFSQADAWSTACDPVHGLIYAAIGNAIYRFPASGAPVKVLGLKDEPGDMGDHESEGVEDEACLKHPAKLQIQGDYMFIADTGNQALKVFNLQTQALLSLAGDPTRAETRPGPLVADDFHPSLPAALKAPRVFFVNADGDCLVAQDNALMHLDLGAFATAAEPERGGQDDADERMEAAGHAGSAAAPSAAASSSAAAASSPQPGSQLGKRKPVDEPEGSKRTQAKPQGSREPQ